MTPLRVPHAMVSSLSFRVFNSYNYYLFSNDSCTNDIATNKLLSQITAKSPEIITFREQINPFREPVRHRYGRLPSVRQVFPGQALW